MTDIENPSKERYAQAAATVERLAREHEEAAALPNPGKLTPGVARERADDLRMVLHRPARCGPARNVGAEQVIAATPPLKVCPQCFTYMPSARRTCPACGMHLPRKADR